MTRPGFLRAVLIGALALAGAQAVATECPDQTQAGLNQCSAAAYAKADEALNRAYKEIQQRFKQDSVSSELFVKAQKSWIAFRDAECSFSSSGVSGGSAYPMIYELCLEMVTKERTKRLQEYLRCEEGDLSCPVPVK